MPKDHSEKADVVEQPVRSKPTSDTIRRSMQGIDAPAKQEAKVKEPADTKKVPEGLSPEQYEKLRAKTPSAEIQAMVNEVPAAKKVDPVYGFKVKKFEADHIVSMKRITQMPGFSELPYENQVKVLNHPENFMGLAKRTNDSKGSKSWAEWPGHPKLGPVPPKLRSKMVQREKVLERDLQKQISKLQKAS